jgi:hypothetical protein
MQDLDESTKETLRGFKNSVFWPAYLEWVLAESAKCLGSLRTSNGEGDAFTKGMMLGLDRLRLDLFSDMVENGLVEKAAKENMGFTKSLLEKNLSDSEGILSGNKG